MNKLILLIFVLFPVVIQAQDNKPEIVLQVGHMSKVTGLAVSPDGKTLASGGMDHTAKLWDAASGSLKWSLAQPASVLAVGFDGNGRLLTAGADGGCATVAGGQRKAHRHQRWWQAGRHHGCLYGR